MAGKGREERKGGEEEQGKKSRRAKASLPRLSHLRLEELKYPDNTFIALPHVSVPLLLQTVMIPLLTLFRLITLLSVK